MGEVGGGSGMAGAGAKAGTWQMKKTFRTTPKMLQRASELRKEQTPAEAKLWAYLRARRTGGIIFRRQHAIGPYHRFMRSRHEIHHRSGR